jgi:glycosyltransferase involved in cell wall biosynthesis
LTLQGSFQVGHNNLQIDQNYKQPKLLIICSTLNLDYPYGATPAIWQLLKGFFEVGCDTVVIPYRGMSVRTPWWRTYPNPTEQVGELYANSGLHKKRSIGIFKNINEVVVPKLADFVVTNKWKKSLCDILVKEKHFDAVLLIGVPLNHFNGLSKYIKGEFSCPLLFYDLDVPTSLPKYGGFSFSYYIGADIDHYDAILVPSDGVSKDLAELTASRIFSVHFGVDPDLYLPLTVKQDIDVFFFATSDDDREREVSMMISEPSTKLDCKFLVSGINYNTDLKNAKKISMLPFSLWRYYASRSKINLNITRHLHASTFTSTSRPFELAAMGCSIVSHPYCGLDRWFTKGKELFIVEDTKDAVDLYNWLINNESVRKQTGERARKRVLTDHTFRQRALRILDIINSLRY